MKIRDYLHDERFNIFIQTIILLFLNVFFHLISISLQDFLVLNITIISINFVYHVVSFLNQKTYYNKLIDVFSSLEEKNLISEFIDKPEDRKAEIFYNIILQSGLALNNKIAENDKFIDEYKEYIERWVHEIKLPISVIKLISDKRDDVDFRSIKAENETIEKYVEQVLYYARSNIVENDYFIKEVDLLGTIRKVIRKHKNQFITKNVHLEIADNNKTVLTDSKWIEFIISQIIDNAVKYSDDINPVVIIDITTKNNLTMLSVSNSGTTIPPEDVNRVFEKGFTGKTGRTAEHSTGIGLYLVKKLCDSLGHKVVLTSNKNKTVVTIIFSELK